MAALLFRFFLGILCFVSWSVCYWHIVCDVKANSKIKVDKSRCLIWYVGAVFIVLYCNCDGFGWDFICGVKGSPMTIYMEKGCLHGCLWWCLSWWLIFVVFPIRCFGRDLGLIYQFLRTFLLTFAMFLESGNKLCYAISWWEIGRVLSPCTAIFEWGRFSKQGREKQSFRINRQFC